MDCGISQLERIRTAMITEVSDTRPAFPQLISSNGAIHVSDDAISLPNENVAVAGKTETMMLLPPPRSELIVNRLQTPLRPSSKMPLAIASAFGVFPAKRFAASDSLNCEVLVG